MSDYENKANSPAIFTVMWANQPVLACFIHAQKFVKVAEAIGLKLILQPYYGDEPCINCVSEDEEDVR